MAYTLERLAADCRLALEREPGPAGREVVRGYVSQACLDPEFVAAHLGPDNDSPRRILHEDERLGFCILAHVHRGASESTPHDHGPSWAIYGQAAGVTEMTEWRAVSLATHGESGKVEATRVYSMQPGDAEIYQEGELHSPRRERETRLIRIEGRNLDGVPRNYYDKA
jgi:hypothetical protein